MHNVYTILNGRDYPEQVAALSVVNGHRRSGSLVVLVVNLRGYPHEAPGSSRSRCGTRSDSGTASILFLEQIFRFTISSNQSEFMTLEGDLSWTNTSKGVDQSEPVPASRSHSEYF
ncbi:Protein of unknown function [Cotesia congregata]|uniref:Uncharacterized protein n=1 Tax=Cotesia congregata TaxID=51543 RepID=A0A8J2HAP2_COTCN|nr:Protein of unknown function [Cotesia congregata]